jgi:effector-binding domain-containing protein
MTASLLATTGCQLHPRPTDAGADTLPAPTPALSFHISHMRIQMMPPADYLYASSHTSFDDISAPASQTIPALGKLVTSGTVQAAGPVLFVYHDPSENPSVPFDLEIGLPLRAAPASPIDGFTTRKLPAFRCATVIYRGPMKLLPKAYDKLIPEMIAAGLVPSNQTRESYLVWESPDSPNNVMEIEVGIDSGKRAK